MGMCMWKIWASAWVGILALCTFFWLLRSNQDKAPTPAFVHIYHMHIPKGMHNLCNLSEKKFYSRDLFW